MNESIAGMALQEGKLVADHDTTDPPACEVSYGCR